MKTEIPSRARRGNRVTGIRFRPRLTVMRRRALCYPGHDDCKGNRELDGVGQKNLKRPVRCGSLSLDGDSVEAAVAAGLGNPGSDLDVSMRSISRHSSHHYDCQAAAD